MHLGRVFAVYCLVLLLAGPVLAVGTTGSLVGTVSDPSGRVVVKAKVRVRNQDTNAIRDVETNPDGAYTVPLLPAAVYEVSVEFKGFRRLVYSDIKLDIEQTVRVDVVLQLGKMSEHVTVSGAPPVVQTDTSTLGLVIDEQKVSQLPLNERNFLSFTLLVPGAQMPSDGSQNSSEGGAISVNGAREQSNNFLLDGVDNNDLAINQYSVLPSVDAIQEFKVQSGNSSAEFGRSGGAQINVVTKSGTNHFHGTGFEFTRNRHLDAKNFFDQPHCTPISVPGTCAEIPRFDRNQFGGTLGGPLRHSRTFFFGSYEGLRLRQATTREATVPSQNERAAARAAVPSPNPAGLAVLNLLPAANVGTDLANANSFVAAPIIRNSTNQVLAKVDHHFSENDVLSGEYSLFNENRFNPFDPLAPFTNLPGNGSFTKNRGQLVRLASTHTFNTRMTNELRIGFNRLRGGILQQHSGANVAQQLGFPDVLTDPIDFGMPDVLLPGFDSVGEPTNTPQDRRDNTFHYADTLAWNPEFNSGRHQFKFGVDIRRFQLNFFLDALARGEWIFSGGGGGPVAELVQLLQGTPDAVVAVKGNSQTEERATGLDFFAQDDIRVNSRFTLNAGLRYEYNTPVVDRHDRLSVPDLTANALTCSPQPDCQFISAGTSGVPRATYDPTKTNFAPRIGFAWRPLSTGRFVVRAAYGIFYDVGILNGNIFPRFNPPLFDIVLFPNTGTSTIQDTLKQTAANLPALPSMIARNFRDGYMQQWNFNFQYEVMRNTALDFAYVGSKGTHLIDQRDFDQAEPGGALPFPAYGGIDLVESQASSTYHAFQLRGERRAGPDLVFLTSYTFSRAIDNASALFGTRAEPGAPQDSNNLRAERGLSNFHTKHRFVFSSVYELPFGNGKRWMNRKGTIDFILSHWLLSGIMALQSGRPFTVVRGVDQSMTGSFNLFGFSVDRPDVVSDPFQPGPVAANPTCGAAPSQVRTTANWLNPCAFVQHSGGFGNEGRNNLIGPGFRNLDFSILKNFLLGGERRRLQFHVEFFNLPNHPNFDLPNNNFDSGSNFGRILSANAFGNRPPRQIQFGLKFIF